MENDVPGSYVLAISIEIVLAAVAGTVMQMRPIEKIAVIATTVSRQQSPKNVLIKFY
jgi:hypothetical protein